MLIRRVLCAGPLRGGRLWRGGLYSCRNLSPSPRYLVPTVDQEKTAVWDSNGEHTFARLSSLTSLVSECVRAQCVRGSRVGVLLPSCVQFPAALLGVMHANCVPVPLNHRATPTELEWLLGNCGAAALITSPDTQLGSQEEEALPTICLDGTEKVAPTVGWDDLVGGVMIYTSGTTGKPKGVLAGHEALAQWVRALVEGWKLEESDTLLHTLPLYHVHGVLALLSVLSTGGSVDMRPRFSPAEVWAEFLSERPPSLYFGVPTQYSRLIDHYDREIGTDVRESLARLRLMVSGSAALRESVSDRWAGITGHRLLERYGMTEVGLVISNPLEPVSGRRPGCIGLPFPGVEVRVVADDGEIVGHAADGQVISHSSGAAGELQIRGATLFSEYFDNPTATQAAFTPDGWFQTGDTARIHEGSTFQILGRTSLDVIKSGGYKLSALEIERSLLEHPLIGEVAVIGVEDEEWGQRVVAVVEASPKLPSQETLDSLDMRGWCRERFSPYKIPKEFILVQELPRNHMGKVGKKLLLANYPKL